MLVELTRSGGAAGDYQTAAAVVVDGVSVATVTRTASTPCPASGPWHPGELAEERVILVDGVPVTTSTGPAATWETMPDPMLAAEGIARGMVEDMAANPPEVARWSLYMHRAGGVDVATEPVPFALYQLSGRALVRWIPEVDPRDGGGSVVPSDALAAIPSYWPWKADSAGNLPTVPQ